MFQKLSEAHGHATRQAGNGIQIETRNQGSIKYKVPKEWSCLSDKLKECKSRNGFKERSKGQIIGQYRKFECRDMGCGVCGGNTHGTSQSGQVE